MRTVQSQTRATMKKQQPLTLQDYCTFQYMRARPAVAQRVVNEITSFVFYDEPHDTQKPESDHKVMLRGSIDILAYYICCLVVLPSHVLGMSDWMSATENDKKDADQKILRRFRYSYYWGLLQVDTRHIIIATDEGYASPSFRLVEYMHISIWAWVVAELFYIAFVLGCTKLIDALGFLHDRVSFWTAAASIFVPLKVLYLLYRLQFR
jgi:hypothetical protein